MEGEEQYELLATDGMLVKRPLVVGGSFLRDMDNIINNCKL